MSAFDRLLEQIDAFIRKHYKSEILKGVIIFLGVLFASWLVVSVAEYFGRFSSTVRLILLLLFLGVNSYILVKYFLIPIFRLYSFGKRINRIQAASIIGSFFPTISDRLLNTLQLNDQLNENDRSYELIRASVAQRSKDLLAVKFEDAVRYEESKKYLKYVLPVIAVFCLIGIVSPSWISKGSSNVVHFAKEQEAPFEFHLVSPQKKLREGDSYEVVLDITGLYVPEHVFLVSNRGKFKMKPVRKNRLSFTVNNLRSDLNFHFLSEGFKSPEFTIQVLGNSSLGKVVARLHFPKYLNRKDEVYSNSADMDVPEGTLISWNIETKNTNSFLVLGEQFQKKFTENKVTFQSKHLVSENLKFILKNAFLPIVDTSIIQIHVTKDAYPSILVAEHVDSLRSSVRLFEGMISDDYGLTNLSFVYTIRKKDGSELKRKISVQAVSGTNQRFSFAVDFSRDNIAVEDKILYHFTVTDNDGVNGGKTSQSQQFVYELPTLIDLNQKRDEIQKEINNALTDVFKRTEKFQKDVQKLQKSLLSKSKTDFKNLEQVQQLKQQQQQLQHDLEAIQEKLKASNEEKNKLSEEQNKELLEQQELIEKLLNEVMDDELKKLLEELEELMQKNDQQQIKNETEKLNESSQDMKKQLDRTLEMLKKLQVNEKIDAVEKELEELAAEQEKLKDDIKNNKIGDADAQKRQDEINKRFDEIKQDLKEIQDLNSELSRPMNLDSFDKEQESISKDLQEAKDKLDGGKKSKAGENQKNAADSMRNLAEQLNSQQEAANKKQNQEDMSTIRLLLENLMALSFNQEDVMNQFTKVRNTDPAYNRLGQKQRAIMDDARVVEDSLVALAKRQPKVAQFIDKELKGIRDNFKLIVEDYGERRRRELQSRQQYAMMGFNNLALLLNESLQQMQQEAQSQQQGNGSCENPGGSGKKPSEGSSGDDMKEMLKKQLEQMKKGANPGGKDPGNKPGEQTLIPGMTNKEAAKMAAQQAAIRQRLEQLRNELNKDGSGQGNKLNPLIKELEQQERDLVNKRFSPEMIRRQQDILTRLLESENALRERGFEEKRESVSGKNVNYGNLIRFDEYKRTKLGQIEVLRSVDPVLTKYYKDKANRYFNLF